MHYLPLDENFLAIEEEFSNYQQSKIAILSVPYEHSVTYGTGTSLAPKAIIDASSQVEFYDEEFDRELCFNEKITTLPEIDFADSVDSDMLYIVKSKIDEVLKDDKFVVTLGGEHTISYASIKSHYEKYSNLSVLHFDAHADLRDEYLDSKWSHACVMARVCEFLSPQKLTQVGIRALCKEENEFIKKNNVNTFFAAAIRKYDYGVNWMDRLIDTLTNEVYISFDVDFFDPSIMPTTGTPEPNGFLYHETVDIFRKIIKSGRHIIGLDVTELAPVSGVHHTDLMVARLIYKILNICI